jgi:hypothetical protein
VLSVSLTGTDKIGFTVPVKASVLGGAKEIRVGFNTLGIYEEEFGCKGIIIDLYQIAWRIKKSASNFHFLSLYF